jgi:hypothetical protein
MKSTIFYCILGFTLLSINGFGQDLFGKKAVLQISIETNLNALLKDKEAKPAFHWAKLAYVNEQSEKIELPIRLKTRGNFRRTSGACHFPPLLVDFSLKKANNTLFDNQIKLKLVTQCVREDLVFHEYLVYEIYNLLTDLSFKARLVEVTYVDSSNRRKPMTNYGFFIENETDVAKRNAVKNSSQINLSMSMIDTINMATVSIFEYLIGNNDWSLSTLHNIKLFTEAEKRFLPMPYDFDHAGIVEASYALPPPQLEIASVRERLYRGLDYPPSVFQAVFDKFNTLKPQIYALYEGNPLLDSHYIKRTLKYFDAFYETINEPKAIKKYFTAGRVKN